MVKVTRLPSGLRIATASLPHMESVSVGLWIGIGGRYEPAASCGISHFIEHLLFKGTRRRTAKQISQEIEGIGGYLNAFTGEEITCYYARGGHRHLATILDVLTDMYLHSRFGAADIRKERAVIKDELLMYRDQPQQYVHELLTETLWPSHPLGRALTGTPESLDAISRAAMLQYHQGKYLATNTVVAVAGHCTHTEIVQVVQATLPLRRGGRTPRFLPAPRVQRAPRLRFFTKDVEQTHLAIALRGYSRHDRRRYALRVLNVLLGENMSSRLFQVIREEHGLAYSIQSSANYFADTGALVISAGLDPGRLPKALRLILREAGRLARTPPSVAELRRAKDYAIGQMRLGLESTTNQMMWIGEHLLAYGFVESPEEIERQIEAVTPAAIQEVAVDLFRNRRLNAAVITPGKNRQAVERLLRFE